MSKYISKFWITFTAILSIVFIALFVPLTVESIGIVKTVVYHTGNVLYVLRSFKPVTDYKLLLGYKAFIKKGFNDIYVKCG